MRIASRGILTFLTTRPFVFIHLTVSLGNFQKNDGYLSDNFVMPSPVDFVMRTAWLTRSPHDSRAHLEELKTLKRRATGS